MNSSDAPTANRPWYLTSIWPMVIGIPALTVVAGLSTVVIANHRADPPIDGGARPDIVAAHPSRWRRAATGQPCPSSRTGTGMPRSPRAAATGASPVSSTKARRG